MLSAAAFYLSKYLNLLVQIAYGDAHASLLYYPHPLQFSPGGSAYPTRRRHIMEVMLLVALVAIVVVFAARVASDRRVAVRVPARISRPRSRRR
jgi:hypothetical protein